MSHVTPLVTDDAEVLRWVNDLCSLCPDAKPKEKLAHVAYVAIWKYNEANRRLKAMNDIQRRAATAEGELEEKANTIQALYGKSSDLENQLNAYKHNLAAKDELLKETGKLLSMLGMTQSQIATRLTDMPKILEATMRRVIQDYTVSIKEKAVAELAKAVKPKTTKPKTVKKAKPKGKK